MFWISLITRRKGHNGIIILGNPVGRTNIIINQRLQVQTIPRFDRRDLNPRDLNCHKWQTRPGNGKLRRGFDIEFNLTFGFLFLFFFVISGKPKPHVRWWRGQTLIDTKDKPSGFAQVVNNQLVVPSLERSDLHAIYTCTASNTNITQPVSTAITVEMHRK